MGYYKQKTSVIEYGLVCNVCLIIKRKGWEDGFIAKNIEIEFWKSQLTFYLFIFFAYGFFFFFLIFLLHLLLLLLFLFFFFFVAVVVFFFSVICF